MEQLKLGTDVEVKQSNREGLATGATLLVLTVLEQWYGLTQHSLSDFKSFHSLLYLGLESLSLSTPGWQYMDEAACLKAFPYILLPQ